MLVPAGWRSASQLAGIHVYDEASLASVRHECVRWAGSGTDALVVDHQTGDRMGSPGRDAGMFFAGLGERR
jgi:hypothetical protein